MDTRVKLSVFAELISSITGSDSNETYKICKALLKGKRSFVLTKSRCQAALDFLVPGLGILDRERLAGILPTYKNPSHEDTLQESEDDDLDLDFYIDYL